MDASTALHIRGGKALIGNVHIDGSKTATCLLIAASMLNDGLVTLSGVPWVSDVRTMLSIATANGVTVDFDGNETIRLSRERHDGGARIRRDCFARIERSIAEAVRASIVAAVALALRHGRAVTYLPGGCGFASRPVDIHLRVLAAAGASVASSGEVLSIDASRTRAFTVSVDGPYGPSVGATVSALLLAAYVNEASVIRNVSTAPEVSAVIGMLTKCGVDVVALGSRTLRVTGPLRSGDVCVAVEPDRIEAGTYAIAAAVTGGRVVLLGMDQERDSNLWMHLSRVGVAVAPDPSGVAAWRNESCTGVDVVANYFPLFPTDLHPQLAPLLATHSSDSLVTDVTFSRRISHLAPLAKYGVVSRVLRSKDRALHAYRVSPSQIRAARGTAPDIRAGAALVVAALAASSVGWSDIHNVAQIERGYARLPEKLMRLGGDIRVTLADE